MQTLGRSQFQTSGKVVRVRLDANGNATSAQNGQIVVDGHAIDLNVNVPHGQMEDFMKLTSKTGSAMLTGVVATKAHLLIPPGHEPVEHRLKLDGTFDLSNARFASDNVQAKIEQLSLRGQGKPKELKTADPTLVRSEMRGTFHMANGVIALPDLNYSVPGADIQLAGSYSMDGTLEFDGTARMQATVSQMLGGWKGILLKPANKFFEKDGAGTLVPIKISGTREAPQFGVDFSRMNMKGTKPERPDQKQPDTKAPDTKQPAPGSISSSRNKDNFRLIPIRRASFHHHPGGIACKRAAGSEQKASLRQSSSRHLEICKEIAMPHVSVHYKIYLPEGHHRQPRNASYTLEPNPSSEVDVTDPGNDHPGRFIFRSFRLNWTVNRGLRTCSSGA